jgi:hypothetical protein
VKGRGGSRRTGPCDRPRVGRSGPALTSSNSTATIAGAPARRAGHLHGVPSWRAVVEPRHAAGGRSPSTTARRRECATPAGRRRHDRARQCGYARDLPADAGEGRRAWPDAGRYRRDLPATAAWNGAGAGAARRRGEAKRASRPRSRPRSRCAWAATWVSSAHGEECSGDGTDGGVRGCARPTAYRPPPPAMRACSDYRNWVGAVRPGLHADLGRCGGRSDPQHRCGFEPCAWSL